jgi:hypothetical protein
MSANPIQLHVDLEVDPAKENNLVEAAERLASKFHERLEPPPPAK